MPTIVARNLKLEVVLTYEAAVTGGATAISLANVPVVSDAAHGLEDGEIGFWTVANGMVELDEQAFMVDNKATDNFEMPGFETTNYSAFVQADSTYTMAATFGTLAESAGISIGGGASTELDDTRTQDTRTRNISGNLAPQTVTIDIRNQEVDGAAMAFISRKARQGEKVLMRATKAGKTLFVWYGTPSLPGMAVAAGAAATGQFTVQCPGWVVKPNV